MHNYLLTYKKHKKDRKNVYQNALYFTFYKVRCIIDKRKIIRYTYKRLVGFIEERNVT